MAAPMRETSFDEEPVIAAIRTGDRYAFTEFVRRNEGWVRSVLFSVFGQQDVVDDVAQIVWTSVWRRIGELRETGSWRSWLYRLARNAALDVGRERTRQRKRHEAAREHNEPGETVDAASGAIDGERRGEILRAIQALPEIYREPFVLRHMNDWSYRRIADVMGLPVDTVETRLVRARRLLRDALRLGAEKTDVEGE